MSDVLVLGSANIDLVVRQSRLPEPGETMFGSEFLTVPGGKGLNQAIAAARSGADVGFLGAVGRDAFGAQVRRVLEEDGIGTSGLAEVDAATGVAVISVLDSGENSITVISGANAALTALDKAARRQVEAARYLVAQFERPLELITEAFTIAHGLGIRTVLTPAPVLPVQPGLLALADILVPNAQEARELAGSDDETQAALALSGPGGTIVMTRGSRGALVAENGTVIAEVPARKVTPVDTTGAGDTFAGYLVGRLSQGDALEAALHAASVAASISVTRPGATSSIPHWDEVAAQL
jgi:ribokinase